MHRLEWVQWLAIDLSYIFRTGCWSDTAYIYICLGWNSESGICLPKCQVLSHASRESRSSWSRTQLDFWWFFTPLLGSSGLHPLSQVILATARVVAFVLLCNYRFSFHCYTQRETTPSQKLAWKWRCDLLQLLARKIRKGIHSCKAASLLPSRRGCHLQRAWYWCAWLQGDHKKT